MLYWAAVFLVICLYRLLWLKASRRVLRARDVSGPPGKPAE